MVYEPPLFPDAPKKRKASFSLWRVKPVEEWTAAQFYGYFVYAVRERGREPANSKEAALARLKALLELFEKNLGQKGKEAFREFIDQCLQDPRCRGVGYLSRQAESFLEGQAWRYRDQDPWEEL